MFVDKFFLLVLSVEIKLFAGLTALDPDNALKNYAANCQEILEMSDPFDRLDKLHGNFDEDFFKATDEIVKTLMQGPLGRFSNGTGVFGDNEILLLSSGLPYLKELSRTFTFIRNHTNVFWEYHGMYEVLRNSDSLADAVIRRLESMVHDVSYAAWHTGDDVQFTTAYLKGHTNVTSLPLWGANRCEKYVDDADRMLESMNERLGNNCSEKPRWDTDFYPKANDAGLKGGTSNRCLHKFLLRYSNYSEPVYSKFVDITGQTLFFALNIYGLRLPFVDEAGSAEKKAYATTSIRAISAYLKDAFWDDGGTDASGRKTPISSSTVTSEYWPDTAIMASREAFGSETATWPSPEAPNALYKGIGERILKNMTENFAYRSWFNYTVAVYWPAEETREHCVLNLTNDVFYELRYKNVDYFVSRRDADRKDIDLERMWQRMNDSGVLEAVTATFTESTKPNLCDRIKEVSTELSQPLLSMGEFRSLLAVQCARKFVWHELGYHYFHAVWASHQYVIEVQTSKYSPKCASVLLFP